MEQGWIMKNNRKAYRIYMALSPESRKILSFEYEIEKVENTENKNGTIDSYITSGTGYG